MLGAALDGLRAELHAHGCRGLEGALIGGQVVEARIGAVRVADEPVLDERAEMPVG